MLRSVTRVALVIVLAGGVGACGQEPPSPTSLPSTTSSTLRAVVSVVTTTTHLADFARRIGGDRVTVQGVLRANVDPHDYEPSPADLTAMGGADLIIKNGVGFEKWFDAVIRSAEPRGPVLDASEGIPIRRSDQHEEDGHEEDGHGDEDPHIWHDPRNAAVMARTVARGLEAVDPTGAALYRGNLEGFVQEIERLDAEIAGQIGSLTNRKLVTNHDAFGYFIVRYGLEYVGSIIPNFDSSAELSARDISDIVRRIRATGTRAVFSETSVPPKTAEVIGREAGVRVVAGDDALYGDSLGPPGSDGATYVQMMRHNARVIVDNLR